MLEATNSAALDEVVNAFNRLYYQASGVWIGGSIPYFGIPMAKNPCDVWMYQELIDRVKPRVIIETGTWYGGSAQFLANTCLSAGVSDPLVITIDVAPMVREIGHPQVLQLINSSIVSEVFARCVKEIEKRPGPAMVILDADHRKEYVLAEMKMYALLVTEGSYLIVEDTNVNGHPVYPEHGPGPMEAVQDFFEPASPFYSQFVIDHECEKYGLTFNPSGYLRRI